jgi:thiol-disulfide isomerase/thioredoxin
MRLAWALAALLLAGCRAAQVAPVTDHPAPAPPVAPGTVGTVAPELVGIHGWVNSKPLTLASLRGKVVLVDFWTYSCVNCVRTLPHLREWDKKYRSKGLVIIGVHTPEFAFEKSLANIKMATVKYGIRYPVANDSDMATWNAYMNQYWPADYLVDQNGKVVDTQFGEGYYAKTENAIRRLLGLKGDVVEAGKPGPEAGQTQETYLGTQHNVWEMRHPKGPPPPDHWQLSGKWKREFQRLTSLEAGATVTLHFKSTKVYLVMGSATGQPVKVSLRLNGKPLGGAAGKDAPGGTATVTEHRMYEVVNQGALKDRLLDVVADEPGVQLYVFTFGR